MTAQPAPVILPQNPPHLHGHRLEPEPGRGGANLTGRSRPPAVAGRLRIRHGAVRIAGVSRGQALGADPHAGGYRLGKPKPNQDLPSTTLMDTSGYPEISIPGRRSGEGRMMPRVVSHGGAPGPLRARGDGIALEDGAEALRGSTRIDLQGWRFTKSRGVLRRGAELAGNVSALLA